MRATSRRLACKWADGASRLPRASAPATSVYRAPDWFLSMSILSPARLAQVLDRFDSVEARMGVAADPQEIVQLAKDHAELKEVADAIRRLTQARAAREEAESVLADLDADADLRELAEEEAFALRSIVPQLEQDLQILLLPKDSDDNASIVLEVRAGTGGDEAAIFAGDLFRMYQRFAALQGWRVEVESASDGEMGGYKEIIATISGEGVFGRLKFESGVHRVQRVPETETQGRVHTSAATVAVLPAPEKIDIEIKDADIRIDTMRASGAGGQHVNKTDSAVRITHMPSGIVVTSSDKSQHQNRAKAMKMLQVRLYEMERERISSARSADRKSQVGSGDRSERIRTYNYPQGRVTDHRINLTLYNLPEIVAGPGLAAVIDALLAADRAEKLAALEEAA